MDQGGVGRAPPGLLLVLYASETGNAQDVAERIAREARAHLARHRRRAQHPPSPEKTQLPQSSAFSAALAAPLDAVPLSAWPRASAVALCVSTSGQGEAPRNMRATWRKLLRRSLPPDALAGARYALFGLGDSGYVDFCAAALRLDRRLAALGAARLCARALGDDRAPGGGHEAALDAWLARELWPALGCGRGGGARAVAAAAVGAGAGGRPGSDDDDDATAAAPAAAAPAAATLLPPPRFRATVLSPPEAAAAAASSAAANDWTQEEREHAEAAEAASAFRALTAAAEARAAAAAGLAGGVGGAPPAAAAAAAPAHGPWRPLMARIVANRRVTAPDHFQETRHLEFDLAGYAGGGLMGDDDDGGGSGRAPAAAAATATAADSNGNSSNRPLRYYYEPGDVLAIFPRQPREDVDTVLRACGLSGDERLRIEEEEEDEAGGGGGQGGVVGGVGGGAGPAHMEATARAVVSGVLDVSSASPRRHVWEVLAAHARELAQALEAAAAVANPSTSSSAPAAAAAAAAAASSAATTGLARQRAERLGLFASAAGREDAARYAWGTERRALAEVLRDFFLDAAPQPDAEASGAPSPPPPRLSLARLLESCPRLRPRLFSLASSPRAHGPRAAHVLAAVVAWRSPSRRPLRGLATGWLASLPGGGDGPAGAAAAAAPTAAPAPTVRVPVWIERGEALRPPADPAVPLLLIGPGTGVAPFRAILHERAAMAAAATVSEGGGGGSSGAACPPAPCHLFFGCRSAEADFYYRDEWEGLVEAGALARDRGLVTAFSRPAGGGGGDEAGAGAAETTVAANGAAAAPRTYVTHRLREHADLVWDLVERRGAHVLVSGSASRMPADVADALADVAADRLPPPPAPPPTADAAAADRRAAGRAWVKALEARGRFRVEAWS